MFDLKYLKSQTVLFVEDEEVAREILAKVLSKMFKNVITASNGLEAYEKFERASLSSDKIDLIISDINMPIVNGLDMLENIRKIDNFVPAIFVTARSETSNILRAIDLNVTNYIIKPIQTDVLLKKIADACEKKFISNELNEKKEELENYLEAVDTVASIFKMNDDGKILFANKSLLEISEYSKEEFENLNFSELIHPDVSKESIEKTWEIIRKNEIWNGNTKFISKNKEAFYLKNTVFKVVKDSKAEYITIGFSTTKESLEKREFQKKVLKSIQEFNKKEHSYKKLIEELSQSNQQLEAYIPRLVKELEDQKMKTVNRQRQLDHYELQMHNVDEKYSGHMSVKSKEVEDFSKNIAFLKQEKANLIEKNKNAILEIEATKKELELLTKTNEQKMKEINNLRDVIKSLESKIKDLTQDS
ncbi:MAG: response regulator [Aliarcobacter sp.]|nr:response regulator [Aliarcobacter sp.]MBP6713402.1 response regulator [Aliarcobacter sp.]MBP7226392.1 response regulator [Aliarcobacter sp.]